VNAPAKGPIVAYDFPLDGPDGWHEANRYLVWTGRFAVDAPVNAVQEWIDGAAVTLPASARALSLVPAGTPHRLTHLFGFWRISDADLHVVRAVMPSVTYLCLNVSSGPEHKNDRGLWYCPGCGNELAPSSYDVRRYGAPAFWDHALERVRAFNADPAARTCPRCGTVHPTAFGFDRDRDTPDERIARAAW
jgi:hypothetical protein